MQITKQYLDRINPKSHPRYSPNLYRFLKRKHCGNVWDVGVFKSPGHGTLIGFICDGDFIGCKLGVAMTDGPKTIYCYGGLAKRLKEIKNFWEDYANRGRCAIDHHTGWFVGDNTRWKLTNKGRLRDCLWCGSHRQKRRIKKVVESVVIWEDAIAKAEGKEAQ